MYACEASLVTREEAESRRELEEARISFPRVTSEANQGCLGGITAAEVPKSGNVSSARTFRRPDSTGSKSYFKFGSQAEGARVAILATGAKKGPNWCRRGSPS